MPWMPIPGPDDPIPSYMIPPAPGALVYTDYTLFDVGQMPNVPLFRVVMQPRSPGQTDVQWEATVRASEQYYLSLSIRRFLAHGVATELGFHARCRHGACRRAHRCVKDKNEFDWGFPGPWMPPCANTSNLVDQIRERIRALLRCNPDGKG